MTIAIAKILLSVLLFIPFFALVYFVFRSLSRVFFAEAYKERQKRNNRG